MTMKKAIGIAIAAVAVGIGAGAGVGSATSRAVEPARVATVDGWALVQRLLNTDAYAPARDEYFGQWQTELEQIQTELQGLQGELQLLAQNDPTRQPLAERFQQRLQQLQAKGREAQTSTDAFSAEQAAEAFEKVRAAAVKIAKEQGYTHLISGRAKAIDDPVSVANVAQEILSRPLLMSPDADDITEAVRVAMDLPEELPTPESASTDGSTDGAAGDADSDG